MSKKVVIPFIVSLVLLLVSGGVYGFAYYVLIQSGAKASLLATQITEKSAELDRLARGRAALANLSTDEATISQYTIGKEDVVPFLETLQSSGKPLGAVVDVLSVSDAQGGEHPRITLSLSITGSFDSVMKTLGSIEYAPYDGMLTNLTLDTTSADAKGVRQWTAASVFSLGIKPIATSTPSKP